MSHSLLPIVKFTGGEYSPSLDNRIDLPGFRDACRRMRNVVPFKQGGAQRRPGSLFVANGKVAAGGAYSVSRLQKFQFAPGTTFMLEFCDHGIRFYSNGAQVQVNPTILPNWTSGSSYPAGSFVQVGGFSYYLYSGTNGLNTQLNNSTVTPGADLAHWTPQTAYEVPAPYSATNFGAPNYWESDVFGVVCEQINDVVYLVHPNYPVWKLTRYTNVYTGVQNTGWISQQVQFLTPAMMDENATDETLTASATTGSGVTLTATAAGWATSTYYVPGNSVTVTGVVYTCLQVHTSGTFANNLASGFWVQVTTFQSGHVGSYWQLAYNRPISSIEFDAVTSGSNYTFAGGTWQGGLTTLNLIGTWEVQTYGTWSGNCTISVSYDNGTTYQVITTLTSRGDANFSISGQELNGGIYKFVFSNVAALASTTPPRVVLTADNQFVYGLVEITAVASAYSATCTVITPLYATTATQFWSEGAWSAVRGYPQAVTIFQERVWYGYSTAQPQHLWATQTDDIENFAIIDQSQATYGLSFDLNAPERGPIQWLAAQTDLFVGLASAEWIVTSGGTGVAITPSQVQALEHTVNGSAPSLPGFIIGQACYYVQRKGRSFQQMMFSVFTNKYMSQDMQVTSQHLTNAGIEQFDYQQQFQEQSLLWAVCGDGTLISMTLAMDQQVFAWAKHVTGDQNVTAGSLTVGGYYTITAVGTSDFTLVGALANTVGLSFIATGPTPGTGMVTIQNDVGFLSVQVIYGAAGADDEVWVSTKRAGGGAGCQIERLNPVDWQTFNVGQPQLNQAVYADCATVLSYPTNYNSSTLDGLPSFLIGRTLVASIVPFSGTGMWSVRNLPCVAAAFPAIGGAVTIPNYVPAAGDTAVVGLPINWYVQPMRFDVDPQRGPIPGVTRAIEKIYPRTLNSMGGQWANVKTGQVFDIESYPIWTFGNQPPPFTPNTPQDTEIAVGGIFKYDLDSQICIQGFDPLPYFLLGIAVKHDVGGSS